MKPPAGGDVEGGVAMVYGVESPEKWDFVVETVPDVHPQVDEQDDRDGFGYRGKGKHSDARPDIF